MYVEWTLIYCIPFGPIIESEKAGILSRPIFFLFPYLRIIWNEKFLFPSPSLNVSISTLQSCNTWSLQPWALKDFNQNEGERMLVAVLDMRHMVYWKSPMYMYHDKFRLFAVLMFSYNCFLCTAKHPCIWFFNMWVFWIIFLFYKF